MIDYYNVLPEDFEKVFANIEDAILHYPYWNRDNNFFRTCCINCGVIRYYNLPLDFYLVKKEYFDLLFCSQCWEEIESISKRKGIKFNTEKYVYEQVIKEIEN